MMRRMQPLCWAVAGLLVAGAALADNGLAVNSAAAARGTSNGLQVTCAPNGSAGNVFVQSDEANAEKHFLMRFTLEPSTLTLAAGKAIRIGTMSTEASDQNMVVLFLKRSIGDQFQLRFWFLTDTVPLSTAAANMTQIFLANYLGAEQTLTRTVEIEWTASSAPGANDGSIHIRRYNEAGDTLQADNSISGLDTDTLEVGHARFGILGGTGNTTVNCTSPGHYFFDEFESYR